MKKEMMFKVLPTLLAFLCANPMTALLGQTPLITRLDGVGAGNTFLEISDLTRQNILDGTFDGTIQYLPDSGPFSIEVTDPDVFQTGEYELTLFDDNMADDVLGPDIYWRLKRVATGEEVTSPFTINSMPEQEVQGFGFKVRILQMPDVGEFGPNNGAIGATITFQNPGGPQWLEGITEGWHPTHLDFVQSGHPADPDGFFSSLGDGYFFPYLLCNWVDPGTASGAYGYLSPAWLHPVSELVTTEILPSKLNNVDLVFTSDKSQWSRCIVVETAMPDYYNDEGPGQLGLSTGMVEGQNCSVENFDLRGAPSVGKEDADGDGLPDPDGDGVGMGWFPGYAIDVETGQRLNVFFGENSVYSLDQDLVLLNQYGIGAAVFEETPSGRDMMWNPSSQRMVDAGDSSGFPYQFYLGGQHFVYVTFEPYDACAYLRSRLGCDESSLKKINALKQIAWAALPVLADSTSLLSYADGLIPNEATVKLRVDNPFQVETGTGAFNGYPAYRFDLTLTANHEAESAMDRVHLSPNPYRSGNENPLFLHNLPPGCEIAVFNWEGRMAGSFINGDLSNTESEMLDISGLFPGTFGKGVYFIQIRKPGWVSKNLRVVVF